jgi:hypothetical protein
LLNKNLIFKSHPVNIQITMVNYICVVEITY